MIKGVQFSGIPSGIKASGLDLGLVYFREPNHVTALYTRNRVKAAHILYNRRKAGPQIRALLVNSGCANACTGQEGIADLSRIADALSRQLDIEKEAILFASTGVIGKRLPVDTIVSALPDLTRSLKEKNLELFARAIMTTDTYPKIVQEYVPGKKGYSIYGVAKGAGMINPLFATMLSFVFTDYALAPDRLKRMVPLMGRESFERISVDGDTSTNDTVMVFCPGAGGEQAEIDPFRDSLSKVLKELSLLIVRDGEGATKVIHVTVQGAKRKEIAERIARRIATSPLVKTAFFGCDPNWGRIICAAGDADVPLQPSKVEILIQGELLVKDGMEVDFSEMKLKRMMDKKEIELIVNLHDGKASYDMYFSDLTYDYIKINASYRT